MSLRYRILYRVGFTPWEQMTRSEPIVEQISALFAREEQGRAPPYGPALDLGCGSAIWAVALAERGWQVTGVDAVPLALRRARERAEAAGVAVRLVEGDVTRLRSSGVEPGFRLLLDFGLFHDGTDEQRQAIAREASAVAAPGATMLMLAWRPARRRMLPRGASRDEIEAAYPAWTVTDADPMADEPRAPRYVREAEPRFYRLRRSA